MKKRESKETEIIRMLGRGHKTAEIATKLNVSVRSVEWAIGNLKARHNANNITELVVTAIKEGIVELDEL